MMHKTMRLFVAMICFSMNAQASLSVTTLVQCVAPIVSCYAAYQSKQDVDEYKNFLIKLDNSNETFKQAIVKNLMYNKKEDIIGFYPFCSYFYAAASVAFVATSINQDHSDQQFMAMVFAVSLSGLSLGHYIDNHNRMVHIEAVAQCTPTDLDLQGRLILEKRKKTLTSDTFRQK